MVHNIMLKAKLHVQDKKFDIWFYSTCRWQTSTVQLLNFLLLLLIFCMCKWYKYETVFTDETVGWFGVITVEMYTWSSVHHLLNNQRIIWITFDYFFCMWLKYSKCILQSKASLVCVRWRRVGRSAVPAALRRSRTTTPTSTNATSASTSSSRCTATCRCCTRSSAWTPCCSRLVYPTTRPSASSSSSTGLSGPDIIAKSDEWIEGLKVEQHCGQEQDGWKDGWMDGWTARQKHKRRVCAGR